MDRQCKKCGFILKNPINDAFPIEDILCPSCLQDWYRFFDENYTKFNVNPKYKGMVNPTWDVFLKDDKEKVVFT